jgi:hypothetical protein
MTRSAILILVGLLMVGCKSQPPTADPFFGRATIPPPPTGAATGRVAEPAYLAPPVVQAAPQSPSSVAPPFVQMPGPVPSGVATPTPQTQTPQMPAPQTQTPQMPQTSPPPGIGPVLSTPRPTSTIPGAVPATRPSPIVSPTGTASSYVPPGGTFNYRGTSTQGAAPLVPTQAEIRPSTPSIVGISTSRTIGSSDDRTPRPVDDAPADAATGGRKPIIQTIQPRPRDDASNRRIDISDLPKADGTTAEVRPTQPVGP